MFQNKRRHEKRRSKGQEYWQSYSDMMAALLLMFILLMVSTLFQSMDSFEKSEAELKNRQATIDEQQVELDAQKENQLQLQEELEEKQGILDEAQKQLKEQEKSLKDAQDQLKDQQTNYEDAKSQLQELSRLVGVKTEIIEALKKQFADSSLTVQVDSNTGAITFDSSILFAYNKSDLSNEGSKFLEKFLPMYLSVLLGDEFKDYISEIIIEGHTDSKGGYMYNLALSQDRAYAVAKYCLDEKVSPLSDDSRDALREIMTANGRSFSDLIFEDGVENQEKSRRVVFKFRVKDEEMIKQMQLILEE